MHIFGIDIGGSGIKGAVVDVAAGNLITEPLLLATPQPATPTAVAQTVGQLIREADWRGIVGCGFPAVIRNGVAKTAANIDAGWIDIDAEAVFHQACGREVRVLNDADAAGLAEIRFGAGRGRQGSILMLTLGTGIGSALFYNGRLFPNLELGSFPHQGHPAEQFAAAAVKTRLDLSWSAWAERLNQVLATVEGMLSPDLIIIGGGVSSRHEDFFPFLHTQAQLLPAELENRAGIVGAAFFAGNQSQV